MPTLTEALRDPNISKELQEKYGGDARNMMRAASTGDQNAIALQNKIKQYQEGTSANLTTTPSGTPKTANYTIPQARTEYQTAQEAYNKQLVGGLGFEEQLKSAIQKRAELTKPIYDKQAEALSGLRKVGTDVRKQYGAELAGDPFALREAIDNERSILEGRYNAATKELKEKNDYIDDIIKNTVSAYKDLTTISKLNMDIAKERLNELESNRKEQLSYIDKYYEGPEAERVKGALLEELGVKNAGDVVLGDVNGIINAIQQHESGATSTAVGDYDVYYDSKVGVNHKGIGQWSPALGKYQILGINWVNWGRKAGIPEEYLNWSNYLVDKGNGKKEFTVPEDIQDAVGGYQIAQYYDKYNGDIDKTIAAWNPGAGQRYVDSVKQNMYNNLGMTLKKDIPTDKEQESKILDAIDEAYMQGKNRVDIEDMIWERKVDPNKTTIKNKLDKIYGEAAGTDVVKKATQIVDDIMSGDNRYLKMTDAEKKDAAKGKFDERKVQYGNVNWGSIDTKYEDEVARILRERLAQLQEEKKSNKNVIGNLFRGDLYFGQKKGKG